VVVRVRIDRNKCVVAHFCLLYAPTVFVPLGDLGKPAIAENYRISLEEGAIPDELVDAVKEAEKNCPSKAIRVYV